MKQEFSAKKELKKLKSIVECLPEERKKMTEGLVKDAAFMAEQLEKLRNHISAEGVAEEYQNGEHQKGRKLSPEADMYVKLQKLYSSTIKQLTDLLPSNDISVPGAELLNFISK